MTRSVLVGMILRESGYRRRERADGHNDAKAETTLSLRGISVGAFAFTNFEHRVCCTLLGPVITGTL